MRHFIAYHNTEKMGYVLPDGELQTVLTNKSVTQLPHNAVWIVTYEGTGNPRRYCLGSVFLVKEVGHSYQAGFKRFASGLGHVFRPPIPVNGKRWFPKVLRTTANFSLGLSEIKDRAVITQLIALASQAGCTLS